MWLLSNKLKLIYGLNLWNLMILGYYMYIVSVECLLTAQILERFFYEKVALPKSSIISLIHLYVMEWFIGIQLFLMAVIYNCGWRQHFQISRARADDWKICVELLYNSADLQSWRWVQYVIWFLTFLIYSLCPPVYLEKES